jgi:hypothetical protein
LRWCADELCAVATGWAVSALNIGVQLPERNRR